MAQSDNFARSLAAVLQSEGGWSDNPADPGGATMKGITLASYMAWRNESTTKDDLRNIPDADLQAIYRQNYWLAASCDKLAPGLDYAIFDAAVNTGVGRACKFLQQAAMVPVDGHVGPVTLAAANGVGAKTMIFKLSSIREAYYRSLPTFKTFGKGWLSRLNAVTTQAASWAA